MRTTINIYRQLGKYLEAADAEAQAKGKGPEDTSIDADFRSGVYLGVGLSNLVLSLMPSRLLTIVELFGYKGDRHAGSCTGAENLTSFAYNKSKRPNIFKRLLPSLDSRSDPIDAYLRSFHTFGNTCSRCCQCSSRCERMALPCLIITMEIATI